MQRALVEQAQQGDQEAFEALARQVGDRCMAIARRILRDHDRAEDAVQAALVTAWRELRTLRDADRSSPLVVQAVSTADATEAELLELQAVLDSILIERIHPAGPPTPRPQPAASTESG